MPPLCPAALFLLYPQGQSPPLDRGPPEGRAERVSGSPPSPRNLAHITQKKFRNFRRLNSIPVEREGPASEPGLNCAISFHPHNNAIRDLLLFQSFFFTNEEISLESRSAQGNAVTSQDSRRAGLSAPKPTLLTVTQATTEGVSTGSSLVIVVNSIKDCSRGWGWVG